MRIALITPLNRRVRPGDEEENLGVGYLASVLRHKGHEVRVLDGTLQRLGHRAIVQRLLQDPPELVGISALFQESLGDAGRLAKAIRLALPHTRIVAGGQPATFCARELLEHVPALDGIVMGEGEGVIEGLATGTIAEQQAVAHRHHGEIIVPDRTSLLPSLDILPDPARDHLPVASARSGAAQVSRSRGCWGSCSFCSLRAFYGAAEGRPWRVRSPERVVAEIEALRNRFGINVINFVDDNFIGPGEQGKQEAKALAQSLIDADTGVEFYLACRADDVDEDLFAHLQSAGLRKVFLGIESGVQNVLDRFGKRTTVEKNLAAIQSLDKLGIEPIIGFITFDPDSTFEEFTENLAFLEKALGSWAQVRSRLSLPLNIMEIYSGTPIEKQLREEGRLKGDYLGYTYDVPDVRVHVLVRLIQSVRRCVYPLRNAVLRTRLNGR